MRYELVRAEAERDTGSKNPDAIDLAMRGRALLWPPFTKDKVDTPCTWFEKALKSDPSSSAALAGDAYTYVLEFSFGSKNSETDYDTKILGQADRSITLDRDSIQAYLAKSFYLLVSSRPNDALRAANAALAIDPNSASLLATLSIAETYLRQFEQAKSDVQQAMHALELVGLADKRNARADELSGGQQQRLAIARVLMQKPEVILADEPIASLDPALAEEITSLLIRVGSESKVTLIVSLHRVELALEYFSRVIGLSAGKIRFDLPPNMVRNDLLQDLYGNPLQGGRQVHDEDRFQREFGCSR